VTRRASGAASCYATRSGPRARPVATQRGDHQARPVGGPLLRYVEGLGRGQLLRDVEWPSGAASCFATWSDPRVRPVASQRLHTTGNLSSETQGRRRLAIRTNSLQPLSRPGDPAWQPGGGRDTGRVLCGCLGFWFPWRSGPTPGRRPGRLAVVPSPVECEEPGFRQSHIYSSRRVFQSRPRRCAELLPPTVAFC